MKHIKLFEEFVNEEYLTEGKISYDKIHESVNESKVTLILQYNTDDDDIDYVKGILKKAGISAIVKAGIDSEEVEIMLSKSDVKKATKALSTNGFELQESVSK